MQWSLRGRPVAPYTGRKLNNWDGVSLATRDVGKGRIDAPCLLKEWGTALSLMGRRGQTGLRFYLLTCLISLQIISVLFSQVCGEVVWQDLWHTPSASVPLLAVALLRDFVEEGHEPGGRDGNQDLGSEGCGSGAQRSPA